MDEMSLQLDVHPGLLNVEVQVKSLHVTDNSGDKRFPFIFENLPVEGQEDLVSFKLQNIDKKSPKYVDCETIINLGFSGLTAYWKPKTMINLVQFINQEQIKETKKKETKDRNLQLEIDRKEEAVGKATAT